MAGLSYVDDTAAPAEARNYDPLPKGAYLVQISDSKTAPTAAGNGEILTLTCDVLEPEAHRNRKIFHRINYVNANAVAQKIGQEQLAAVRVAAGVARLENSEQLHGIPIAMSLKIRPAGNDKKGVYRDAQNEVTDVKPASAYSSAAAQQAVAPAAVTAPRPTTTAAPASNVQPWKRGLAVAAT